MRHRIISIVLVCVLLLMSMPICGYATNASDSNEDVIYLEDGSYITISIDESSARASSTKTGRKTYTYKDSEGTVLWTAALTASFTYTGTTSTCTSASCTVTISDSDWYEKSNTTTRSGNTATTELTMGKKFWGITFNTFSYTITLTCDANGNLS